MTTIKSAMELPLDVQIRIQDRGGTGITHSNWEVYHKLRDEGSVWFIITRITLHLIIDILEALSRVFRFFLALSGTSHAFRFLRAGRFPYSGESSDIRA